MMNWTTATHIGTRERNEDAFKERNAPNPAADGDHPIAVVCDGLGGHAHGDVASRTAADAFMQSYLSFPSGDIPIPLRLDTAVQVANGAIRKHIEEKPELDGMGTTLVAAAVTMHGVHWTSVGDSPLAIRRRGSGRLRQINERHNVPGNPHQLTSALMGDRIPDIDGPAHCEPLEPGDTLIAASDGLDTLEPDTIEKIAATPGNLAVRLIEAVNAAHKPRQDNVTAVCLHREEQEDAYEPDAKCIHGIRRAEDASITIEGKPLDWQASLSVRNHSPSGVEWGYAGSGPSQLALAILLTLTNSETAATRYQAFKEEFISPIRSTEWRLPVQDVLFWLMQQQTHEDARRDGRADRTGNQGGKRR